MKRIYAFIFALTLLFASTATAASWTQTDVVSPYEIGVIPIKVTKNILGVDNYSVYRGSASAGDTLYFTIRASVPEKHVDAIASITAKGATLNCVLSSSLPGQGLWYMREDGTWSRQITLLTGYATENNPSIKACVKSRTSIKDLTAGQYRISVDSGGYIFENDGCGVVFYPDATGKVYSAKVFNRYYGYTHSVTPATFSEDTSWGVTLRSVFKALGMEPSDYISGNVYMTDQIIQSNFGYPIDTCHTAKYCIEDAAIVTTEIPEVPATGVEGDIMVILGVCVMVCIALYIRKVIDEYIKK